MSRNRFQLLFRYIHFNDNTQAKPRDHTNYDSLFKISPLLKRLRDAMARIEPEERHSVDEQIIPFKGRSGLKQYIKNKPHLWGFKVFARAGISGLIYDFEVYTGKAMKLPGDLSVSANVVLRLVEKLPNDKNFKLYFDNWFSSVDLVSLLKERSIWSLATIRPNRLKGCILTSDNELKRQGCGSLDSKWEKNEHIVVVNAMIANQCISFRRTAVLNQKTNASVGVWQTRKELMFRGHILSKNITSIWEE